VYIKKGEIIVEAEDAKRQKEKRLSFDPLSNNDEWWTYKVNLLSKHLAPRNNDVVLDFGSGSCELSELIASKGCSVTALDISSEMLHLSKKRLKRSGRNVKLEYVVGDCENPPFRNNVFGKCLCWGVMHHLPDPRKAMVEVNRILRGGGFFLLNEPNGLNIFRRVSERKWLGPNLETSFYPWELKTLVEESDFEIVEFDYSVNPFDPTRVRADLANVNKTFVWLVKLKLKHCLLKVLRKPFRLFFGAIVVKCQKIGD